MCDEKIKATLILFLPSFKLQTDRFEKYKAYIIEK